MSEINTSAAPQFESFGSISFPLLANHCPRFSDSTFALHPPTAQPDCLVSYSHNTVWLRHLPGHARVQSGVSQ